MVFQITCDFDELNQGKLVPLAEGLVSRGASQEKTRKKKSCTLLFKEKGGNLCLDSEDVGVIPNKYLASVFINEKGREDSEIRVVVGLLWVIKVATPRTS